MRLRFVWDLLDRVELAEERELLVRKYIYQEPIEQICEEMGFSRNTAYRRHREGLQKVQVMLEEPEKGRGCV